MSMQHAEWMSRIQVIGKQANGILSVELVRPENLIDLMAATMVGSFEAARLLEAALGAIDSIEGAPRGRPCLCSCCPRPLRRKSSFTIAIARPERIDASHYLALAVCARCGTTNTEIKPKVTTALRKLWPDLRELAVHPGGGHA